MRAVVGMEKKASTETAHAHEGKDRSVHRSQVRRLCGSPLARTHGRMMGGEEPGVADTHTHTHNSSWGPSCCCYCGTVVAAGRVRVAPLWTEACSWLLILVNQRHYGDLRIFLVSLQIIVIWQHFSKLESQTKGTSMLERRRFINS